MPPRFDLLVLDLDGTLVDSEALLVGLFNDTLGASGYSRAEPGAVAATIGLPLEEVFRRAVPSAEQPDIAVLCARYRDRADAPEFVRQFRLYRGVAETLERLRATGIKLIVATSKRRATTLDILRHCAIDGMIDAVLGGDSVTCGKPHPEMLHRARAVFGTAADRTMVVGDTSFDIEMGHAAGVATCAVTYGMHPAHTLRAFQPHFVIDRFDALPGLVIDGSA
jgi:phosphoglycolate phosphatase